MSFVLDDLKYIEKKVSREKKLTRLRIVTDLSILLDGAGVVAFFYLLGYFNGNDRMLFSIITGIVLGLTPIILRGISKVPIETNELMVDDFCDFLKILNLYSKTLILKYESIEKQKIDDAKRENNGILAIIGAALVVWFSIMGDSVLSKYQNESIWTVLVAASAIVLLIVCALTPYIKWGGDYLLRLGYQVRTETLELLNAAEIRIIKEQEDDSNVTNTPIHHPRKGY